MVIHEVCAPHAFANRVIYICCVIIKKRPKVLVKMTWEEARKGFPNRFVKLQILKSHPFLIKGRE
jgi:hypothetical protein